MLLSNFKENKRSVFVSITWLLFLVPFFYASYNFTNNYAANLEHVNVVAFFWEKHIPFVPWTIIPYWSENLLYGLAFFICFNIKGIHRLGLQLLTIQIIACSCFLLFPLRFSFEQPEVIGGISGFLFQGLSEFDKPFNQAPSLHIALVTVLWRHYLFYFAKNNIIKRAICHIMLALITLSVLTTYQHHFIDIPTGFFLGVFALWLWPQSLTLDLPFSKFNFAQRTTKLAMYYFLGSIVLLLLAAFFKGLIWWLLWPSMVLVVIALAYMFYLPHVFQKQANAKHSFAASILFSPYFAAAKLNKYLWTKSDQAFSHITKNLYVGRQPSAFELIDSDWELIVDCAPEMAYASIPKGAAYIATQQLDLNAYVNRALLNIAHDIKQYMNSDKKILIHCALGYSRSAQLALLVLCLDGMSLQDAQTLLYHSRPKSVLSEAHLMNLTNLLVNFKDDKNNVSTT